jgi:hypothetical protein
MDRVTLTAFAIPPTSPAFPPGPYRFVDREYFIIRYRTDLEALRRIVPEPLEIQRVDRPREFSETICATPVDWPATEGLSRRTLPGLCHSSVAAAEPPH